MSAARRPRRETTGFAALGGTPVFLFVHVFEVGVGVGVVVDVECMALLL
jgi:hypothetical protein